MNVTKKTPTKATKKVAANSAKKAGSKGKKSTNFVSVRMYNVGFGDAFLVKIALDGQERRLLFDCGSIAAGPRPMDQVVAEIIEDCRVDGEAKIDVVVATHRHKDHVSGFALADWQSVAVGEVWMPWTEDPKDPKARSIRNAQSKLCLGLAAALSPTIAPLALNSEPPSKRLPPIHEMVLNAMSNQKAMDMLHRGFKGTPVKRFLPVQPKESKQIRAFTTEVLPGVTIHVLGPSRDRAVISEMDPPRGKSYLAAREGNDLQAERCKPFRDEFRRGIDDMPYSVTTHCSDDDRILLKSSSIPEFDAAVALDQAVNGTSLMLVLEIRSTYFLFPGDAQWGTWKAALADEEWRELLGRTKFYKVGHHGSHNATPKEFVEEVAPDGGIGMASTMTRSQWPAIPKPELLAALHNHHFTVARSDEEDKADQSAFLVKANSFIETIVKL